MHAVTDVCLGDVSEYYKFTKKMTAVINVGLLSGCKNDHGLI